MQIDPCLWFDNQAEEAAKLYTSLFKKSKLGRVAYYGKAGAEVSGRKEGSVMTVEFEIEGQNYVALNGGPIFKFTPGVSLFVSCETEEEIDHLWKELSKGGKILFELKEYPWAKKYAWCMDRFGLPWQLILSESKQKIAPAILFTGKMFGKGEEAIEFYTSAFKHSMVQTMHKDPQTKTVMHARFSLGGQEFVLMEGQKEQTNEITHALSLMVNCKTQEEVDEYWQKLSEGGSTEPCGWLKDKYGVSWQVVPEVLADMMSDSDPIKTENVMKAMLTMKKLDIAKLKDAYR
ncbi:VOC family protein [Bdellovibrio sp. HCB-162]|uniref:VOC family protein n=1 Tax=Bdellovibrio sp. HCB-162 TaxID=3394234 RepID=UPI0039BC92E4